MIANAIVCARCGCKIFFADAERNAPENLRKLRKRAGKEGFHFTLTIYELCPKCGYELSDLAPSADDSMTESDFASLYFTRLEQTSRVIRNLRSDGDNLRNKTEQLRPLLDRMVLIQQQGFNLKVAVDDYLAAAEELCGVAKNLADALAEKEEVEG